MKVSAIQMDCVMYDVDANLKTAEGLVREAADKGAKIIVLPELFNTGYDIAAQDYELSESVPGGRTTKWMEGLCKELGIFLAGAIVERDPQEMIYDTCVLTGPEGYIGRYRKNFLWGNEVFRFAHGQDYPVFDIGIARVGMQICYEVGFPEGARALALKGANMILYSAAFGRARSYVWKLASRARALENGLYVVASNRWGSESSTMVFADNSRIIDPKGDIMIESEEKNAVLVQDVDLEEVHKQRYTVPYLRDYRQDLLVNALSYKT